MGIKKAEFDADFESVEKVAIISCKKVIIYFYYHAQKFSAYNFWQKFLNFFIGVGVQHIFYSV
jgi:hypothetical protein